MMPGQFDPWTHVLAALLLVARLGDVVSTRLVTPRLRRRGRRGEALAFVITGAAFVLLAGLALMWLVGFQSWGSWFGFGIVLYGTVIGGYGSHFVLRVFRRAQSPSAS
jgi:uncharacterized membrane protein